MSYLAIWRRRWLLVVAAIVLAVGAAVVASALTQPQYAATSRLFVTTTGGASVVEAYQGNLFGQDRVLSYVELAKGKQVAQRTIDAMKLDITAEELMPMVNAERVPTQTVLFDITVTNPNPDLARDLANVVAQQTSQLVEELETSSRGGSPAASAVIVDLADTPTSPVTPSWLRNILAGLVGGLLIGLVAAVARDKLDRSVGSAQDAATAVGGRPLGAVPPRPRGASGIPFGADEPEVSEAFRAIRTRLTASHTGQHGDAPTAVLVTEPKTNTDTAAVTLGLGAALAESGRRTVVVDADLHNRSATQALGLTASPGLWDVLTGRASLDRALVPTEFDRLAMLPAGPAQHQPGQLLGSPFTPELIKQLRGDFEFVLIAGPPTLPFSDVVMLAGCTDGVVLVARAAVTSSVQLRDAADQITMSGAEVVGAIATHDKRRSLRGG